MIGALGISRGRGIVIADIDSAVGYADKHQYKALQELSK